MAEKINTRRQWLSRALITRALAGAGVAIVLMFIFLGGAINDYGAGVLAPFLTVSVGGALGGTFYHAMSPLKLRGLKRVLASLACLVVYVFLLWSSSIPGLAWVGLWD